MVLSKLFEELNATADFDKKVITAVVLDTLKQNKCGITAENESAVIDVLIDGVCSRYELEVLKLAAYWSSDLSDMLHMHLGFHGELYRDHIWPFITNNEIYPGVRMTV